MLVTALDLQTTDWYTAPQVRMFYTNFLDTSSELCRKDFDS